MELASFLKPGLKTLTGSSEMSRRLSMAVLAAGLAVPAMIGYSAFEPAMAAAKHGPAAASKAKPSQAAPAKPSTVEAPEAQHGEEPQGSLQLRDIAELRVEMQPFAGAAVRHGLDPVAFVTAVALYHGLLDQDMDPDTIQIAPGTGRKGERLKILDKEASRWVDLVRAHGKGSGAGLAVDTLNAAMSMEDGQRRKPVTEATVRKITGMWADGNLEAEILAREVVSVKAKLPGEGIGFDATATYMTIAYGLPKMANLAKALYQELPGYSKGLHAPSTQPAAYKVLDAASDGNVLFFEDLGGGKARPVSPVEFVGKVKGAIDNLEPIAKKAVEASQASLDEDVGYEGPRFG